MASTLTALSVAIFCGHGQGEANMFGGRPYMDAPQPVLIKPSGTVDLSGKDSIEFSWSPHEGDITRRKEYDFRVYKGGTLVDYNLVFKKSVTPRESSVSVDAKLFETGGLYTWTLRQIYDDSTKSPRAYMAITIKR